MRNLKPDLRKRYLELMKKFKIISLIILILLNFLGFFLLYYQTTPFRFEKLSKYPSINKQSTSILIIYGDHDAGSGGQRHNEFKSYLENMGYTVDTIHINTFILDSSIANQYNLLIIDRSCTSSHNIIKDTGKPILALGYGGGLFFTNALGFPSAVSQGTWYDNPHKILNDHLIFFSPNFIGTAGSNIEPVYYGSSWNGDGREYHFEISSLLAGSIALLDYYYDSTEYSTRTVLFAYNISSTQKTIFWGYDSYYPGGGGYTNCITNPLGLNLLENIVEYLKMPIGTSEITIKNVQQTPLSPTDLDIVTITANINSFSNITRVRIYYSLNSTSYTYNPMVLLQGTLNDGMWQGNIINQSAGTNVTYYIYAENVLNISQKVGPFSYLVNKAAELIPPELINITRLPIFPTDSTQVTIIATLQDNSGVKSAQLIYQINSTEFQTPGSLEETHFNVTGFQGANVTISSNETVSLSLSGDYFANYSFTTDADGANPAGWVVTEPANTHCDVVQQKDVHHKVVEFWDNIDLDAPSGYVKMEQAIIPDRATGSMEFWLYGVEGITNENIMYINFLDGGAVAFTLCANWGGSGLDLLDNYMVDTIVPTGEFSDNVWHHIRIEWNCTAAKFKAWVNGTYRGEHNFWNWNGTASAIDKTTFSTSGSYTSGNFRCYVDAIDYSWATGYFPYRSINNTYFTKGYYLSPSYDLGVSNPYYRTLEFQRTLKPNTNLTLAYRTSPDNSSWSSWSVAYSSNISIQTFKNRYFQFRLNFTSTGNQTYSPSCDWVKLTWGGVGEANITTMELLQGSIYQGIWNTTIPPYSNGTRIYYYLNISDIYDNFIQYPIGYPGNYYGYIVGSPDIIPPSISQVSYYPESPVYNESILIVATINLSREVSGLKNVSLCYSINGQPPIYSEMNYSTNFPPLLNFTYRLEPPFSWGDIIYFNVTCFDFAGNSNSTITYNLTIGDRFVPELTVSQIPLQPDIGQNVEVRVNARELGGGSGIQNVTLYYISNETALMNLDSPHPVPNQFKYVWNITAPNCYRMELFFENISLEENYDYLFVYNETYGLIQQFTGEYKHTQLSVMGNTVRLQVQTDFSVQSWGFSLAFIKFYYLPHMLPMILSSGDIYNGSWSAFIPQQANITSVYYYCEAFDLANNSVETSLKSYLSHEKISPNIIDIAMIPNTFYILPSVSPEIIAQISDNYGIYPTDVLLQYSVNGGAWINLTMNPQFNSLYTLNGYWNVSIPLFAEGNLITYRIVVKDIGQNLAVSSNYSYFIDGTSPNLESSSQSPLFPEYNDSVTIKLTLTDLFPTTNGAGVDNVVLDYYYTKAYTLESDHPYPNNYNHSWIISHPNALGIAVHFTQITLDSGDIIEIYDGNGQHLQTFLGNISNQWSQRTFTNSIEIRLITNSLYTNYGFLIDQYRVYYNSSLSKIEGTAYKGIWRGTISSFPYGTTVWYDITAIDKAGNSATVLSSSYTIQDLSPPKILSCSVSLETPTPDDVNITLTVSDPGSGIKNITLWISLDGGITWLQVPFINNSNLWYVTIPRQPAHTVIKYFITVYDACDNVLRNPGTGYYSMEYTSMEEPTLSDTIELIILIIGMVAAVSFMLFLRSRSRLKTIDESYKPKEPAKSKS
ncbi:MAG: CUB domain-containing protein [Candidatus Helarchaeota archaeon]